jgi:hypothetical protein
MSGAMPSWSGAQLKETQGYFTFYLSHLLLACHEDMLGVLGEWRYSSGHSLTSELDEGERSASCPGRFTPRQRALGTHRTGGWVDRRAVLDAVKGKVVPVL